MTATTTPPDLYLIPKDPELHTETPRDFGLEAHRAAEAHLAACQEALDYEEYGDYYSDGQEPEFPEDMAGPYCGCETCMIRETLHAAWPFLLEAAKAELAAESTPELVGV